MMVQELLMCSMLRVNGSLEGVPLGSSSVGSVDSYYDEIVKVGAPQFLQWALDIGERERGHSLDCFSVTPLVSLWEGSIVSQNL